MSSITLSLFNVYCALLLQELPAIASVSVKSQSPFDIDLDNADNDFLSFDLTRLANQGNVHFIMHNSQRKEAVPRIKGNELSGGEAIDEENSKKNRVTSKKTALKINKYQFLDTPINMLDTDDPLKNSDSHDDSSFALRENKVSSKIMPLKKYSILSDPNELFDINKALQVTNNSAVTEGHLKNEYSRYIENNEIGEISKRIPNPDTLNQLNETFDKEESLQRGKNILDLPNNKVSNEKGFSVYSENHYYPKIFLAHSKLAVVKNIPMKTSKYVIHNRNYVMEPFQHAPFLLNGVNAQVDAAENHLNNADFNMYTPKPKKHTKRRKSKKLLFIKKTPQRTNRFATRNNRTENFDENESVKPNSEFLITRDPLVALYNHSFTFPPARQFESYNNWVKETMRSASEASIQVYLVTENNIAAVRTKLKNENTQISIEQVSTNTNVPEVASTLYNDNNTTEIEEVSPLGNNNTESPTDDTMFKDIMIPVRTAFSNNYINIPVANSTPNTINTETVPDDILTLTLNHPASDYVQIDSSTSTVANKKESQIENIYLIENVLTFDNQNVTKEQNSQTDYITLSSEEKVTFDDKTTLVNSSFDNNTDDDNIPNNNIMTFGTTTIIDPVVTESPFSKNTIQDESGKELQSDDSTVIESDDNYNVTDEDYSIFNGKTSSVTLSSDYNMGIFRKQSRFIDNEHIQVENELQSNNNTGVIKSDDYHNVTDEDYSIFRDETSPVTLSSDYNMSIIKKELQFIDKQPIQVENELQSNNNTGVIKSAEYHSVTDEDYSIFRDETSPVTLSSDYKMSIIKKELQFIDKQLIQVENELQSNNNTGVIKSDDYHNVTDEDYSIFRDETSPVTLSSDYNMSIIKKELQFIDKKPIQVENELQSNYNTGVIESAEYHSVTDEDYSIFRDETSPVTLSSAYNMSIIKKELQFLDKKPIQVENELQLNNNTGIIESDDYHSVTDEDYSNFRDETSPVTFSSDYKSIIRKELRFIDSKTIQAENELQSNKNTRVIESVSSYNNNKAYSNQEDSTYDGRNMTYDNSTFQTETDQPFVDNNTLGIDMESQSMKEYRMIKTDLPLTTVTNKMDLLYDTSQFDNKTVQTKKIWQLDDNWDPTDVQEESPIGKNTANVKRKQSFVIDTGPVTKESSLLDIINLLREKLLFKNKNDTVRFGIKSVLNENATLIGNKSLTLNKTASVKNQSQSYFIPFANKSRIDMNTTTIERESQFNNETTTIGMMSLNLKNFVTVNTPSSSDNLNLVKTESSYDKNNSTAEHKTASHIIQIWAKNQYAFKNNRLNDEQIEHTFKNSLSTVKLQYTSERNLVGAISQPTSPNNLRNEQDMSTSKNILLNERIKTSIENNLLATKSWSSDEDKLFTTKLSSNSKQSISSEQIQSTSNINKFRVLMGSTTISPLDFKTQSTPDNSVPLSNSTTLLNKSIESNHNVKGVVVAVSNLNPAVIRLLIDIMFRHSKGEVESTSKAQTTKGHIEKSSPNDVLHSNKSILKTELDPLLISKILNEIGLKDQDVRIEVQGFNESTPTNPTTSVVYEEQKVRAIAEKIEKKVKILCSVVTHPVNKEIKADHIRNTWGKRCNELLLMSSDEKESPSKKEGQVNKVSSSSSWGMIKAAFKYAFENNLNDADWFLKTDDDTYVIMENLRYMLSNYNASEPIYFGLKLLNGKQPNMDGGTGYVLSREALRLFVKDGLTSQDKCNFLDYVTEDVIMGTCMLQLHVEVMDSPDSLRRQQFLTHRPDSHIFTDKTKQFWLRSYYPTAEGFECCTDSAVSFHNVQQNMMYVLEYLTYHLKESGRNSSSADTPLQNLYNSTFTFK